MHSRNFTDAAVASGKRVLVVGGGKTAADVVTELTATTSAEEVTLLYRRVSDVHVRDAQHQVLHRHHEEGRSNGTGVGLGMDVGASSTGDAQLTVTYRTLPRSAQPLLAFPSKWPTLKATR